MTPSGGPAARPRTVRDPVWKNIRLGPRAAAVVDTPEFQRLRRVKQLGFAHLVYPGAVHTRFLHALGVYHLTDRALEGLDRRGDLARLEDDEREGLPLVRLAALLHDVGHYAFSHAMEEVGPASIPGHHEEMAARFLDAGPIREVLAGLGEDAPDRVAALIRGGSDHPLRGLVSGSLDLDKIDYLRRDGLFCGVPYGAVDVDRLLAALTLARERPGAPLEVGVTEKGISALESLLFAKYQMFRNVYWHHGVRAATAAFRRVVETALRWGLLKREELPGVTDEELLGSLARRWEEGPPPAAEHGPTAAEEGPPPADGGRGDALDVLPRLLDGLARRRLPKRALELFGDELPDGLANWTAERPDLVRELEARLAAEWGLRPGSVFVDHPAYPGMLQLRLLLVRRGDEVQRLTPAGERGLIDLPRIGRSLHHAARVFRVFTLERVRPKDPVPLLELLEASAEEVADRLGQPVPLY